MRTPVRFRIRTILIVTAAGAVFFTFGPMLLKRYRVNTSLNVAIDKGPAPRNTAEWDLLVSDELRVAERLLTVLNSDEPASRQTNALKTIGSLENSLSFRKHAPPQLIAIACDGRTVWYSAAILKTIASWIPTTGLTDDERKHLYDCAARSLENPDFSQVLRWLRVLIATGGQDELQLVVRYFYSLSPPDKAIVCDLLRRQLSDDLLPAAERWMLDPECVDHALELDVLSMTKDGRSALLRYALDQTQLATMRVKAIKQLQLTVAGLDALEAACVNQTIADELSKLLGTDCRSTWDAERIAIVNNQYGDAFWTELIDGLDPKVYMGAANQLTTKKSKDYDSESALQKSQLSLDVLRLFSGRRELGIQADWQDWLSKSHPSISLRQILEAAIERPELLNCTAVLRRMLPYHLAEIPDDCLPLYEKMLTSQNPSLQYWSCKALLHFSKDPDAIDVAIDLIDQDKPDEFTSRQSSVLLLLKERFGVNFFWNTADWRQWAESQRASFARGHE